MKTYRPNLTKKVYISGKITGDPNYLIKFFQAECALRRRGFVTLNPARHVEGLTYEEYMRLDFTMIDICDAICRLPDHMDNPGAQAEIGYAMARGKKIFNLASYLALPTV